MKIVMPWASEAMLDAPWMLPCVMVAAAFALSALTWVRERKRRRKNAKKGPPPK
jgi:hypothetical protein